MAQVYPNIRYLNIGVDGRSKHIHTLSQPVRVARLCVAGCKASPPPRTRSSIVVHGQGGREQLARQSNCNRHTTGTGAKSCCASCCSRARGTFR